jgi:very-short-patch-repair endonuclease
VAISRAKQLLLIVGDIDYALRSRSKLKDIAEYCNRVSQNQDQRTPARPMNIFEKKLLGLLKKSLPRVCVIKTQYLVGNRFTVDFALLLGRTRVAIELDGKQHEIVGELPVLENKQRKAHLKKEG